MKPIDWQELKIKEIGRVVTGRTPPTKKTEYFGTHIPFITPTDMEDHRIIHETQRGLSQLGVELLSRNVIPYGVGVSCIGWQMGKSVLITRPSVTNQQINSIIPNESIIDVNYLYYNLTDRRREIFRLGTGGSRTPILKKSSFEKLSILIPPIQEQKIIANILSAFDDKIELNRQMNATLEEIAQTIYKSWFVDFDPIHRNQNGDSSQPYDHLFPSSFEDAGNGQQIPSSWKVSVMGKEVKSVGGATPSTKNRDYWEDGLVHWTTPKDLSSLKSPVLLDTARKITEKGLAKIKVSPFSIDALNRCKLICNN